MIISLENARRYGVFPYWYLPIQDGHESSPNIARRNGEERNL